MLWNAERYEEVGSIHMAYRMAGCDLIVTNSLLGSEPVLARHGLGDRMTELNRAAVEVARSAAGYEGWVLGDVGPVSGPLEAADCPKGDELRELFEAQIDVLIDGGVDAVLLETMSDSEEAVIGIEAARNCSSETPVMASFVFAKGADGQFETLSGTGMRETVERVLDAGADCIGANCGVGLELEDYVRLGIDLVAAAGDVPVIVQPGVGRGRVEDDGRLYDATPAQMAEIARRLLGHGVRVVGGCCGTTPEHLSAMSGVVRGVACPAREW